MPTEPRDVEVGDTGVDLSWSKPSDLRGENLTGYEILASTVNNETTARLIAELPAGATSYTIMLGSLGPGNNFVWVSVVALMSLTC